MTTPALDLFEVGKLNGPVAEVVRRLAIAGFVALWRGEPAVPGELVDADPAVLEAALDHLRIRGRVEFSEEGHVVAVHGLSRRPTVHRIAHAGGEVNTWCALDAIGIPAALGIDAVALTRCPVCEATMTVTFSGGVPSPLAGFVLWYPEIPGCGHLVDDFCSGANLFCSIEHLLRWVGDRLSAGRAMTIDEAVEIGREAWADVALDDRR